MISGLESKNYERMIGLGMYFVEGKFFRGIQVHKIFISLDNTEINEFFIKDHGRETMRHDKLKRNQVILM